MFGAELIDVSGRHPATVQIAQFFTYDHLPAPLQTIARPCAELAEQMIQALPDGPELTFGLRQLLLAKDAFVRAALQPQES